MTVGSLLLTVAILITWDRESDTQGTPESDNHTGPGRAATAETMVSQFL